MPTELLLVGAGHAHLHLTKQAHELTEAGYRITLVAPRWFEYSGAASGIAAGGRDAAEGRIDVAALTRGRIEHLETLVADVDLVARTVRSAEGDVVSFDVASFNIGSVAAGPAGVSAHESAVAVKPLRDLASLRSRLADRPAGRGHWVTVVGGGPSGVELAGHLSVHPDVEQVSLLEAGPRIAGSLPVAASRRLAALLTGRGVDVRLGVRLATVGDDAVEFADGSRLGHDIVLSATGLAPPPLAARPPLGGPDGIPVRATLQHRDHDTVYAAGDCADFLPGRLQRIGVHGVRQGPVLLEGLLARRAGEPAPTYSPQKHALAILDLGDGVALAVRGRWWWLGRASSTLKHWIDRRWIEGYRC